MKNWSLRTQSLAFQQPKVMGILNVTPDSFSDGGVYFEPKAAVMRALQMEAQGAHMIDVGAESTRPGSQPVSPQEERQRLAEVLPLLLEQLKIPISIDTRQGPVARWALDLGVEVINDISGGQDPGLLQAVADSGAGYVLMHLRGNPQTMMQHTHYQNVTQEVLQELQVGLQRVQAAGIDLAKIVVDPGFGFAKTPEQNYQLFHHLNEFGQLGCPILVGLSRKRMIREIVGEELETPASVVAALLAWKSGASLVRVHDVAETVAAFKTFQTLARSLDKKS